METCHHLESFYRRFFPFSDGILSEDLKRNFPKVSLRDLCAVGIPRGIFLVDFNLETKKRTIK